jgi:hypothetical protein
LVAAAFHTAADDYEELAGQVGDTDLQAALQGMAEGHRQTAKQAAQGDGPDLQTGRDASKALGDICLGAG